MLSCLERVEKQGNNSRGVDAPALEKFRVRLDGALSNPIWLKVSFFLADGL